MGRIPEQDVERVRDATDLVALVSERVALKQKGRLFWGNCPFHAEKTPSFKVDPATQLWHCFGCSRGGDVFGFVMEAEHVEFPDAVRVLAERAHIEVREEGGSGLPAGRKERLIAASEAAADFYHRELTTSRSGRAAAARDYLSGRGFGLEVAKRWRLGYAPEGRDRLCRHLLASGFTREEIVEANLGLVSGAALKDRFYDRVMFPIRDVSGRVIAFGGRILGTGGPKYLNSQETPIFHKSSTLYGLDQARNEIVTLGSAVVVEGYTDVIALHEAGIRTAVATLGTALTERHVRLLGRFGQRVVYLFDGDEAGRRAALRAAELVDWTVTPEAGSARVDLAVALIPDGLDPAEYVAAHGTAAMRAVIDGARPLLRFAIDARLEAYDLTQPEQRSAALTDAAQVLVPVRDSLLGQDYMNYLAERLGTDFLTVQRSVPRRRRGAAVPTPEPTVKAERMSAETLAEREVVRLAALAPCVRGEAQKLLADGVIADETARRVLGLVVEAGDLVGRELFEAVAGADRDAGSVLSGWLVDAQGVEQVEYAFREVSARVRDFALGREIRARKAELATLDPERDAERYDALFGEVAELQRMQQALRQRRTPASDDETEQTG